MKKKLVYLKDKLNDLSMRNRSIRLMKLYKKWSIDLFQIQSFSEEGYAHKIVEKVITQKNKISLFKRDVENENVMSAFHILTTLNRNTKAIEEETGLHDFYLGYPFLSGAFLDGTYFRGPLFLYPVRLELNKNSGQEWVLEKDESEPQLNRSLFLALKKMNQMNFSEEMFEEASELATKGSFEDWVSWLEKNQIKVKANEKEIQLFNEYTKENIPMIPNGMIQLESLAVLGNFPQGNSSILKDYEDLIQLSETQELGFIEKFLNIENEANTTDHIGELMNESDIEMIEKTPREKDHFYLVDSDGSQEEILKEAMYSKGLVIHGPPGTGKSQVIVNLIVDALSKGKKVMVVCQKRAALDVIYQRLDSLNITQQIALIHDEKIDRKKMYSKIVNLFQNMQNGENDTRREFEQISSKIEEREKHLNLIAKGLFEIQPHGYRAYDLYGQTKSLNNINNIIKMEELLDKLNKDNLEDILTTVYNYAEYFQRFGKQDYPLKHRISFENLEIKDKLSLVETIEAVIEKAKESVKYIEGFVEKDMTPEYSWLVSDKIEKIYDDLNPQQKKTLQKLRLWWWTSFTGKGIIEELLNGEKFQGLSSTEWLKLRQSLKNLYELAIVSEEMALKIRMLNAYFKEEFVQKLHDQVSRGDIPVNSFDRSLESVIQDFEELRQMDRIYNNSSDEIKEIINRSMENSDTKSTQIPKDIVENIRQSTLIHWIDEVEKKYPELVKVSTNEFDQILNSFKKLLVQKKDIGQKLLSEDLREKAKQLQGDNQKAVRDITFQAGKKRRIWPLRKYVREFSSKGLLGLFPVWLISPETASTIFPLEQDLFDVVIFDEASQCTVENGIPSIYRATQIFVAGDEMQLPPSNLFKGVLSDDDEDELEDELQESESLLNLSKRFFPEKMLQWHYRSKSEELINFSNHAFYNGQVQIAPNVEPLKNPAAINWNKVDGRWINQCNEVEAIEVVKLLKLQIIKHTNQTVGIITFNAKQQQKILDTIDTYIENDPEFSTVYHQIMGRDIDERIFVKNIENVQGDERDVIIFSVGYAKNAEGKVYNRFGTLNQRGGENRLNVAITRAKEQIIVISSIDPQELNVSTSKQLGPRLFKSYLEYARAVSSLDKDKINQILAEVNEEIHTQKQNHGDIIFDSPFEEEVYKQLRELGYQVDTQVGLSGYRIDLAVLHPKDPHKYILGIECDGAMYHSSPSARERDIYRQRFIESKGWKITRIWSRNWWKSPSAEIEKVDQIIRSILNHEMQKEKISIKS